MGTVGAERAGADTMDADVEVLDVMGADAGEPDAINCVPTLRFLVRVAMLLSSSTYKNRIKG